jgi:peptide deformylase
MKDDIIQFNSQDKDVLYKKCKKVRNITSYNIQKIIKNMYENMSGVGIGIAANQIGFSYQIFITEYNSNKINSKTETRYPMDMPTVPYQVFINPKILKVSNEHVSYWHGCLSALSSKRGKVATYKWIDYEAYNEKGEKVFGRLDDMGAVIFQHEFRHLLGELYLDYAHEYMDFDKLKIKFNSGELKPYEICDKSIPHLLSGYNVGDEI